ncbi:MAG: oligopeptide/dipeptide ABC transporter ATP-binding protein [Rhodospirillales bacterium]
MSNSAANTARASSPDGAADILLEANHLTRFFDVSPPWLNRVIERKPRLIVRAVDDVNFKIARGETLSLVGESGCGKSTIARLIVGLYTPTAGEIVFEGRVIDRKVNRADMSAMRRRTQMIFQDPFASLNPRWRVFDIIAEPIRAFGLANSKAAIRDRVGDLLRQVRLAPIDGLKFPHEFSGGQRQRISIARALASEPEFLVCDEPTSALDVSVQAQILNLMRDLQRAHGLTYLFISHNLAVVYNISNRVGVMYLGRLVEVGDTRSVFFRPKHPYTRMLLDTIPDLTMSGRERMPVAGEVPSPLNPPSGCAFHPRCPFANDRCKTERPKDFPIEGGLVQCHGIEEGRIPIEQRPG